MDVHQQILAMMESVITSICNVYVDYKEDHREVKHICNSSHLVSAERFDHIVFHRQIEYRRTGVERSYRKQDDYSSVRIGASESGG